MSHSDVELQMLLLDDAESRKLYDVRVTVGSSSYLCHGPVLAASSEFFRSALDSGAKNIHLSQIRGGTHTFQLVRKFIYQQRMSVTDANVLDLWQAADFLGIPSLQEQCHSVWDTRVQNSWRSCFHLLCKTAKLVSIVDVLPDDQRLAECKQRFLYLVELHKVMGEVLKSLVNLDTDQTSQLLALLRDVPLSLRRSVRLIDSLMELTSHFTAGSSPTNRIRSNIINICRFVLDSLERASGFSLQTDFLADEVPAVIHFLAVAHFCDILEDTFATTNLVRVFKCVKPEELRFLPPETFAEWIQPLFPSGRGSHAYDQEIGDVICHYMTSILEHNPVGISWFVFLSMAEFISEAFDTHDQLYDLTALYMKKKPGTSPGLKEALASLLDLDKVSVAKGREIVGGLEDVAPSSMPLKQAVSIKWTDDEKSRKRSADEM